MTTTLVSHIVIGPNVRISAPPSRRSLHAHIMSGNPSESSEQGKKHQTVSLISGPQRRRVEVNAIELWNQREEGGAGGEGAAVKQDNSVKSSFISAISSSFESASVQSGPSAAALVINHITPSRAHLTSECMHRLNVHANVGLSCGFTAPLPHISPQLLPSCSPLPCITNGANYFLQNPFRRLTSDEFLCARPRAHLCTLVAKHEARRTDTHTNARGWGGHRAERERERLL